MMDYNGYKSRKFGKNMKMNYLCRVFGGHAKRTDEAMDFRFKR